MIPKIIHYCWFGKGDIPQREQDCIATWHRLMPDWEFMLWTEDNCDWEPNTYAKEAYQAGKYAFVSDYVRLLVLCEYGGIYLDTDVEAYKSFESLRHYSAFVGFEGSKRSPIATCVIGTEPGGDWITEQLNRYSDRRFILGDGSYCLLPNTDYITEGMRRNGFVQNGQEQDYKDLHIFPVEYFCPLLTTGENVRSEKTYCCHLAVGSWTDGKKKPLLLRLAGPELSIRLIKLKRKLIG